MAATTGAPVAVPHLGLSALRHSIRIPFTDETVESCLNPRDARDVAFLEAWRATTAGPQRLGAALSPVTGHVAESVAATRLVAMGHQLIWQLTGPGTHGVDLLMLDPSQRNVVAWEVKGTLRRMGMPRLSGRELRQMGRSWMNKRDNPGMVEWGLAAEDVLGGVVVVQFPQRVLRIGMTADYETLTPIETMHQLDDLSWVLS